MEFISAVIVSAPQPRPLVHQVQPPQPRGKMEGICMQQLRTLLVVVMRWGWGGGDG